MNHKLMYNISNNNNEFCIIYVMQQKQIMTCACAHYYRNIAKFILILNNY